MLQDIDDTTIDCQLYLRRAVDNSFRTYTLIAENKVAVRSFRVRLRRSEFSVALSPPLPIADIFVRAKSAVQ